MAWVTIPDSDIDPDSAITTGLMTAYRDNFSAMAAGDAGAPSIAQAAITGQGALATLDTVGAAQIGLSSSTQTSVSVTASGTWTPATGLYSITYIGGSGGTVHLEVNIGGTWRRALDAFTSGMTLYADGTNVRFAEVAGFARTLYYVKLS